MAIGLTSIGLALTLPSGPVFSMSGIIYGLMGPLHTWNGRRHGKALAALARKPAEESA